jgi:hypothetical protein
MKPVHLVVLWHMHQPQYRDPESGRYVLPWTRLHALKDYWGMVEMLREFPGFHATFNVVPSLGIQLEEYASGNFNEPWFSLAFKNAEELTREDKAEILARAFQVNQERLMSRWPRFVELHEWSRPAGGAQALVSFTPRDWRDLQLLSQFVHENGGWPRRRAIRRFSGVLRSYRRAPSVRVNEFETLCSLSAFVNRGPDDCGANSSSASALCSAACGTHDNSCAVLPGNAGRPGLRGRSSHGNHGGPDRRFGPGRCRPEVWGWP